MRKIDLTIRPMDALDISRVVAIHFISFPTSRSSKLGKPFLQKMYQWYIIYQPKLSFVALHDDKVMGFVAGTMGRGGGRRRFKYTFWYIILGFLRNPTLLLSTDMVNASKVYIKGLLPARKHEVIENEPKSIKFALDSIAVHPDSRGLKVGQALVRVFEKAAESQGATYLALGVEYDNHIARRFYERCGWRLMFDDIEHNSANYIKELHMM